MKAGINGAVHDFSDMRVGINGAVRQASELWIGVNGAAKKVWPSYKPVILDSMSMNTTTRDDYDLFFAIDENGWTFGKQTSGWFTTYVLQNGPIYVYYNQVPKYVIDQAEGRAFNIKGDKFELIGAQKTVFNTGDSYTRGGLKVFFTDGTERNISGWLGLSAQDANSFDVIYAFSYYINDWYGAGGGEIGIALSRALIGGVEQSGIGLGGIKWDNGSYSRTLSCDKIGLQQG